MPPEKEKIGETYLGMGNRQEDLTVYRENPNYVLGDVEVVYLVEDGLLYVLPGEHPTLSISDAKMTLVCDRIFIHRWTNKVIFFAVTMGGIQLTYDVIVSNPGRILVTDIDE